MIGHAVHGTESLRRRASVFFIESAFRSLSLVSRLDPRADPSRLGIEVIRDVPYLPTGQAAHTLDVYRPEAIGRAPLPVVVYIHGGGWRAEPIGRIRGPGRPSGRRRCSGRSVWRVAVNSAGIASFAA